MKIYSKKHKYFLAPFLMLLTFSESNSTPVPNGVSKFMSTFSADDFASAKSTSSISSLPGYTVTLKDKTDSSNLLDRMASDTDTVAFTHTRTIEQGTDGQLTFKHKSFVNDPSSTQIYKIKFYDNFGLQGKSIGSLRITGADFTNHDKVAFALAIARKNTQDITVDVTNMTKALEVAAHTVIQTGIVDAKAFLNQAFTQVEARAATALAGAEDRTVQAVASAEGQANLAVTSVEHRVAESLRNIIVSVAHKVTSVATPVAAAPDTPAQATTSAEAGFAMVMTNIHAPTAENKDSSLTAQTAASEPKKTYWLINGWI